MWHGLATVVAKRICHDKNRQERKLFGCKMTIREMIGMLLQFLLIPGQLIKEHITKPGGKHGICTRFSKPIYKRRRVSLGLGQSNALDERLPGQHNPRPPRAVLLTRESNIQHDGLENNRTI
jgi:hypothetical protein